MRPAWFVKANVIRTTHFLSLCVRYVRYGSFGDHAILKNVSNIYFNGDLKPKSLTVKMALEFTLIVSEASVVHTLRTGATINNFGEVAVKRLFIKGILVTESTVIPRTGKTTAISSVHDGMT